jgi:allantoinase
LEERGRLTAQYETARGWWNLLDVFDRYALRATTFVCGRSAELFPSYVTESEKRSFELVSESYRFIEYFGVAPDVEAEHAVKALQAISAASEKGTIPKSYYVARPSHLTESITIKAFEETGTGLSYSNCAYGDDLPYYGEKNGVLYVPMSLDCNDQSV